MERNFLKAFFDDAYYIHFYTILFWIENDIILLVKGKLSLQEFLLSDSLHLTLISFRVADA